MRSHQHQRSHGTRMALVLAALTLGLLPSGWKSGGVRRAAARQRRLAVVAAKQETDGSDDEESLAAAVRSMAASVLVDAIPDEKVAERMAAPAVLDEEICLMPGVPTVRVEVAPGNARRIFTGIDIVAEECDDVASVVWRVLNDYERLSDAVPNLIENKVVERYSDGAQLEQVGAAKLAPMITFKAKATLNVKAYEKGLPADMEAEHLGDTADSDSVREFDAALPLTPDVYPRPYCISALPHRDITMQGVKEGSDFRFYQGVWRIQELPGCAPEGGSAMRLTYSVELSPKAWVPVALLEGQIATTLGDNLVAIREFVNREGTIDRYSR